jgi:hypothetical protein
MSSKARIYGRIWFFGDEDGYDVETWEQKLEPMTGNLRSGADRAREHFGECYVEADLRKLLEVPAQGAYQVVFSGDLIGDRVGGAPWDPEEYDEWFELEATTCAPIPEEFLKDLLESRA